MRRFAVRSGALGVMALALIASRAPAQGFGVYEHDACTMARAGTGVAKPCNASAVFYNPAGIIGPSDSKWQVALGGTLIAPKFAFRDSLTGTTTNSASNTIPVPNIYITRQFQHWGRPFAIGIGVNAPYGLVSEWPNTFAGRFLAYRTDLKAIYIQPTIAAQITDWLQIGAGFDYVYSRADIRQRLDLSGQTAAPGVTFANLGIPKGTDFADAHLTGSSFAAGGNFGIILHPFSRLHLGARYMKRVHADIQGDATFTPLPTGITLAAGNPIGVPGGTPLDSVVAGQFRTGGLLVPQHASVTIPLPDQAVAGVAFDITPELTALMDYQWVHWKEFVTLPLYFANLGAQTQFEDYNNTSGWRYGLQYEHNGLAFRGGYLHHDAAAPDQTVTPLLPEGARNEITVGVGFKVGNNMHVNLAYQNISQQDRRGRIQPAPFRGPAGAVANTGIYSGSATLFGASLSWGF
jgi:long-chain fatty acid transport protein